MLRHRTLKFVEWGDYGTSSKMQLVSATYFEATAVSGFHSR